MSDLIIANKIKHVKNGYIVEMRWPYGKEVMGYGEVICPTIEGVFELIEAGDVDTIHREIEPCQK